MTHRCAVGLLIAALVAIPGARVRAESSPGGAFRLPAYGARGWGMANAFIVRADDESAVDWNSAGLASARRNAGASYVQLVEGASVGQSQLVFTMPLSKDRHETGAVRHAAGAMFTNLSADISGGESYHENHLRLAYAFTPEPLVSFGIGISAFMSSSGVPGFDAWGTSVDFAGKLSLSQAWSLAVVARDPFSRYTYDDGRNEKKEPQYVLGLAWMGNDRLSLEADIVRSYSTVTRASLGVESEYFFSHVALRGGIEWLSPGDERTVPSFGASVRAWSDRLTLHYGARLDTEDAFGTAHRFSLAIGI
jgi:hypothetical protein